jgi:hypothetical protein
MPYVSSSQHKQAQEIAKQTVRAAIDYLCGRITERQWVEWRSLGCFSPCDANLSPDESRAAIADMLDDLQFCNATLEKNSVIVTYTKRDSKFPRLAPTDKGGISVEEHYHPVRIELHTEGVSISSRMQKDDLSGGFPQSLTIEWKNEKRIDTDLPMSHEMRRIKWLVESGRMTQEEFADAVTIATDGVGLNLSN